MKRIISIAAAFAAVTVYASAQTPQFPLPTQTPLQPQTPAPTGRTPDPLRPMPQQSVVPVAEFSTGDLRCASSLQSATLLVNAVLTIAPDPVRPGPVQVEIVVDGVSAGVQTVRVESGAARVARRVTVAGAQGQHSVTYIVNGLARSVAQVFDHSCVSQAPIRAPAPGNLTLPNLGFGDMLYTQLDPQPPPPQPVSSGFTFIEPRVSIGNIHSFGNPIIIRDIQTVTGAIQFPSNTYCPQPQDAYVSARFAIAVNATRVANPAAYVRVVSGPFISGASFVDTLDQPRYANGAPIGSDRQRGTPLPQGYQWIVILTPLACTRDGLLEIRLDPENSLRETNEGDNLLRLRYSTVP